MPQVHVIRWRDGAGWIVLSGGGDPGAETGAESTVNVMDVETQALSKINIGEPIAYIWAAGDEDTADKHLAALDDMGAPTGYLVDVLTEDDETIRRQLAEAGMIVLGDGPQPDRLRDGLQGAALEAMHTAYARGCVILGIGAGAAVMGGRLSNDSAGLGWVDGAIIVPRYDAEQQSEWLHALLQQHPGTYGLGIGSGSALALGPDGRIEAWGSRQITVALGSQT